MEMPVQGEDAAREYDSHLMPESIWQVVRQAAGDPDADPIVGLVPVVETAVDNG